jgi:mRNA-degrading endonuclease RelE of RelBE toxin-antitoxin system
MEVVFLQSFENDLKKVQDKSLLKKLKDTIINLENSKSLSEVANIKKIKGSQSAFRLRIKDYRLGLFYENGTIELCRFVHRKDIYKLFP